MNQLCLVDKTTGVSTYGTGRFMDITKPDTTTMVWISTMHITLTVPILTGTLPITKENYIDVEVTGIKGPKGTLNEPEDIFWKHVHLQES